MLSVCLVLPAAVEGLQFFWPSAPTATCGTRPAGWRRSGQRGGVLAAATPAFKPCRALAAWQLVSRDALLTRVAVHGAPRWTPRGCALNPRAGPTVLLHMCLLSQQAKKEVEWLQAEVATRSAKLLSVTQALGPDRAAVAEVTAEVEAECSREAAAQLWTVAPAHLPGREGAGATGSLPRAPRGQPAWPDSVAAARGAHRRRPAPQASDLPRGGGYGGLPPALPILGGLAKDCASGAASRPAAAHPPSLHYRQVVGGAAGPRRSDWIWPTFTDLADLHRALVAGAQTLLRRSGVLREPPWRGVFSLPLARPCLCSKRRHILESSLCENATRMVVACGSEPAV